MLLANLLNKLAGHEVCWLDKLTDDRSEKGMVAGVNKSDVFVAVISPQYFDSRFCCLEMHTALEQRKSILVVWNQVTAALPWCPAFAKVVLDVDCAVKAHSPRRVELDPTTGAEHAPGQSAHTRTPPQPPPSCVHPPTLPRLCRRAPAHPRGHPNGRDVRCAHRCCNKPSIYG